MPLIFKEGQVFVKTLRPSDSSEGRRVFAKTGVVATYYFTVATTQYSPPKKRLPRLF